MLHLAWLASCAFVRASSAGPTLDVSGCYAFAASNGVAPPAGCGLAKVQTGGMLNLVYLKQGADGSVDSCFDQPCYRPMRGMLTNTSNGVGMLQLASVPGKGNCTSEHHPSFPAAGLVDLLEFALPVGWPHSPMNKTCGAHVRDGNLVGTFINNGASAAGVAGWATMNPHLHPGACDVMRTLPDCTAFPPGATAEPARPLLLSPPPSTPPPPPSPPPPQQQPKQQASPSAANLTGCYTFGGSAGRDPADSCGMAPIKHPNGAIYVAHHADGQIDACLNQFCYRQLAGKVSNTSNGVGLLMMQTVLSNGNCSRQHHPTFPEEGLFAHIDFVVPAGWPSSPKTKGTVTNGSTLTGVFINNGHNSGGSNQSSTAGWLTMDPEAAPGTCDRMHELPFCAAFAPASEAKAKA